MKLRLTNFIPLIITLPAITIGAMAMYHNKVSTLIWAQNIVCFLLASLISYFVVSNKINMTKRNFNYASILIPLLFVILTFMNPGMSGVHRWFSIGIIRFNASMIVLPILIIKLWKLSEIKSLRLTIITTIVISTLLSIQPDASALTGFAIPMMVMLFGKTDKKMLRSLAIGMLSILIMLSWMFLDQLPPVAYVEGILRLVADMGIIWLVFGTLSLIILPVPFILFPPKNLKLPSICVGLYFVIISISTFYGNFPIPLMGYGISPIIGYFIAITWYVKSINNSTKSKEKRAV